MDTGSNARGDEPAQLTRRAVLESTGIAAGLAASGAGLPGTAQAALVPPASAETTRPPVVLRVNGKERRLQLDPRTTLLDALREHLDLTGSKKGCDHGQCGACTVLIEGRRTLSCLTLAVMHDGDAVTTVEGLARDGGAVLHPLQAAFLHHDGFQCGYCTSGQIVSAAGMLGEHRAGVPSHVTADLSDPAPKLTDTEIRERMSGNLCRCAAYPNIVAAIRQADADLAGQAVL